MLIGLSLCDNCYCCQHKSTRVGTESQDFEEQRYFAIMYISLQVAILLVVSPEERQRRILARRQQLTEEEMMLDKSKLFQERLV